MPSSLFCNSCTCFQSDGKLNENFRCIGLGSEDVKVILQVVLYTDYTLTGTNTGSNYVLPGFHECEGRNIT